MIADAQLMFSDAQAVTADAYGTNVIDLGVARNLFDGEPLAIVLSVDVAIGGTTPTFEVQVHTDDNAAMSSATTLITHAVAAAALTAGAQVVVPVPVGVSLERYLNVYYNVGGTSPTITVTAFLQPLSMIGVAKYYADGITIA